MPQEVVRASVLNNYLKLSGWDWDGTWRGEDFAGTPFFAGEVEPCINGQVAASGAYFGQDVQRIIERLLGETLPDGGWNCEAENGSTRSSFHTTISVCRIRTREVPLCEVQSVMYRAASRTDKGGRRSMHEALFGDYPIPEEGCPASSRG